MPLLLRNVANPHTSMLSVAAPPSIDTTFAMVVIVLNMSDPDRVRPLTARTNDAGEGNEPAIGSRGHREHAI